MKERPLLVMTEPSPLASFVDVRWGQITYCDVRGSFGDATEMSVEGELA